MSEAFLKAAEEAKVLKQTPNKQEMSSLYGLYKQATVGDVNIEAPGMFSFVAKEKWNAWNAKKGLSKEEAEAEYIKAVESLKEKYGI
ncbi:acyl-CoA-binding protein-like [Boleophthalmus pectinirostris]|uniref:acyl-CoA-binding protein-like n=1 Tax=Boleophthalmus pectinirostris TaxID=150288 RepID=UPI000A1C536C|nr:acyl-CoA-binding protein-like [Boleophthalmus pectinirostris]